MHQPSYSERGGFTISEWCPLVPISRAYYYTLPAALQPFSVKFGRKVIITEHPADYLQRIAKVSAT